MNTSEAIRIAMQSLWANKLRSFLTLLGMVIGIASVIAVVTFVAGINGYVAEKIFNLGADVFITTKMPNVITNAEQWLEGRKRKDLTMDDYHAIVEGCDACKVVGAAVNTFNGRVKHEEQSTEDTAIRGWTASMARIYDLELIAGRALNDIDTRNSSPVAVVGYDILENVLPNVDPIGKEIRIDGKVYTVIGVGKKEGQTLGQSRDNWVIIPITSWFKQYGTHDNSIRLWAKGFDVGAPMETAMDQVRVILRSRRHDAPGAEDSFHMDTNQSFLSIWSSLSSTFFFVMIIISSISLVVGGIVIMNIMLVAVTERTREIGIRKALGARRNDVLRQFLMESAAIASVGGIFGILLGIAISKTVTLLIGMPSAIPVWAVPAALTVASTVGIFFGVYPARRAAMLEPITALRFEL